MQCKNYDHECALLPFQDLTVDAEAFRRFLQRNCGNPQFCHELLMLMKSYQCQFLTVFCCYVLR